MKYRHTKIKKTIICDSNLSDREVIIDIFKKLKVQKIPCTIIYLDNSDEEAVSRNTKVKQVTKDSIKVMSISKTSSLLKNIKIDNILYLDIVSEKILTTIDEETSRYDVLDF